MEMEKVGLFYGSDTGNTEDIAIKIQKEFGVENIELFDVGEASIDDLENFSNIILGSSTWGIGEMQGDFEEFMNEVEDMNLIGKKIAIFGLGDADNYSDTFVDAIGIIYDIIKDKGCEIVGNVSTDEYNFDDSLGVKDGVFVGLPIDEDNESDKTDSRVRAWVDLLKKDFN